MTNLANKVFTTVFLILIIKSNYAQVTLNQEVAIIKNRMTTIETASLPAVNVELEQIKDRLRSLEQAAPGPGFPTIPVADTYSLTGTCTALTSQPTDACPSGSSVCYDTAAFVDTVPVSLLGQTFTAIKTTADATDKDGGIWLCDSADLTSTSAIAQCTSIGGNRRDGSKTVEFTIPVGATSKKIYALSMNSSGLLSAISTMTAFSVCKTTNIAVSP